MENQVPSPFSIPPPDPTETEKIQRDYYESSLKIKDGFLEMNDKTILIQNQRIQELLTKNIEMEKIVNKLQRQNKELVNKVKDYEKQIEAEHEECDKQYWDLEDEFNKYAEENETIKQELYKCKFKEKHIEGSRNQNKKRDYDEKCVTLELENLKLKETNEMLASCNRERFEAINNLEQETKKLKSQIEKTEKTILKEGVKMCECELCGKQFQSKTTLKLHIVKDHEMKVANKLQNQKMKILNDIEKIRKLDIKEEKQHKCLGFCLINHFRFRYIKSKGQKLFERMLEITVDHTENKSSLESTFNNPSV